MYGEIRVAARAGRALSCPDAVPLRLPTTPFDRFELVALASIDALSVVRSQISVSELKAMGKPFINVMLGR